MTIKPYKESEGKINHIPSSSLDKVDYTTAM